MSRPLPAPKRIVDLFEELLGRSITVSPAGPMINSEMHRGLIASYVDDGTRLAAVICMEFPLAVYTAASLGLVPPKGANDFVKSNRMSPLLEENTGEVFNILASVLNGDGLPHVRLYQKYFPGDSIPGDVSSRILALGRRLDLTTAVAGYGSGKLSISLTG